jgi:hypothetical protein
MDAFQKPSKEINNDTLEPDELQGTRVAPPRDDDEGLHLMYDYPREATDDELSTQPKPSSSTQPLKIDVTPDLDGSPSRRRTVRFRSRVRITSGVRSVSHSSSCGSVSSSISVPLRGPNDAHVSTSVAPLSDMLPSEPANARLSSVSSPRRASLDRHGKQRSPVSPRSLPVDERTPFASAGPSGSRRSYTEQNEDDVEEDNDAELDRLRAASRKSEEQVMFGKWPWRLLNRHVCVRQLFVCVAHHGTRKQWWWWKFEPIVCCCSQLDEESDAE